MLPLHREGKLKSICVGGIRVKNPCGQLAKEISSLGINNQFLVKNVIQNLRINRSKAFCMTMYNVAFKKILLILIFLSSQGTFYASASNYIYEQEETAKPSYSRSKEGSEEPQQNKFSFNLDEKTAESSYLAGINFRDKGLILPALDCFLGVLKYDSKNVKAIHNVAMLFYKEKDYEGAFRWFSQAVSLNFKPSKRNLESMKIDGFINKERPIHPLQSIDQLPHNFTQALRISVPLADGINIDQLLPKKEIVQASDEEHNSRKARYTREVGQCNVDFHVLMQNATKHFQLGEKDQQLRCYQKIVDIEGLSHLNLARTHANMAVVYLHLGRNIMASVHLQKAEELASLEELETVMGTQTYNVFASTYHKTAQDLYLDYPQKALEYEIKALKVPKQTEKLYGDIHLYLAVIYDRLLNSRESLNHALYALDCKFLMPNERDKALCFAAIGSADVGKNEDCIKYFNQISSLSNLHQTERYLVLSAAGGCYLSNRKGDKGSY